MLSVPEPVRSILRERAAMEVPPQAYAQVLIDRLGLAGQ